MMPLNPPITDWQGKRVWLVGASSGIGAALATELARCGAYLALSARHAENLENFARTLPNALALPMDIAKPQEIIKTADTLKALWPSIDVVIFNAGTYTPIRAYELNVEEARQMIEVNLLGTINGVAAVVPGMIAQGFGHIVIVASVAGYGGLPKALVYGATKAGLINFAQTLYVDLAPKKINVSLVNPGFVATSLTAANDFKMPAIISAQRAALYILHGLKKGRFEIHFPYRFSFILKVMRFLPDRLYFFLVGKLL